METFFLTFIAVFVFAINVMLYLQVKALYENFEQGRDEFATLKHYTQKCFTMFKEDLDEVKDSHIEISSKLSRKLDELSNNDKKNNWKNIEKALARTKIDGSD